MISKKLLHELYLCPTFHPVLQGVTVGTATCVQLHKRAEKIAAALTEKGSINTGENVVLLYPPGRLCHWISVCYSQRDYCETWVNFFFLTISLSCVFLSGIDLIAAFYGCLYAGCVPVNVRPPHPQNLAATLPTVRMIIDVCVSSANIHAFVCRCVLFVQFLSFMCRYYKQ